jgi:hypothetical protein
VPTTLLKRLDQVATVHRQRRARRLQQDLAIFTDAEVEALCELAHKADAANRTGQQVDWTGEERVMLDRLEAKRVGSRGW